MAPISIKAAPPKEWLGQPLYQHQHVREAIQKPFLPFAQSGPVESAKLDGVLRMDKAKQFVNMGLSYYNALDGLKHLWQDKAAGPISINMMGLLNGSAADQKKKSKEPQNQVFQVALMQDGATGNYFATRTDWVGPRMDPDRKFYLDDQITDKITVTPQHNDLKAVYYDGQLFEFDGSTRTPQTKVEKDPWN